MFDITLPQRIFALQGGTVVRRLRRGECFRARFGQADMFDFAFGIRSAIAPTVSSIGHVRIDAVLIEQVDAIDAEPFQATLNRARALAGDPSTPTILLPSNLKPNFVAMTNPSRLPLIASPTSSSF